MNILSTAQRKGHTGRKSSQELGLEKSVSFFLLIVYTPTAVVGLGRWEFTVTLTYMRRAWSSSLVYDVRWSGLLRFAISFDVTYLLDLLYHTYRSAWEGMEWIGSCVCSLILLRLEYLILPRCFLTLIMDGVRDRCIVLSGVSGVPRSIDRF